jgi:hypothetical protein
MSDARAARPQHVGAGETAAAFARGPVGRRWQQRGGLLSPTAALLTPEGTELSGPGSITELQARLTSSSDQQLEIKIGRTVLADRVVLCTQYWARRSRKGGAVSFGTASTARLVLAQEERRWQIVIAAPWG